MKIQDVSWKAQQTSPNNQHLQLEAEMQAVADERVCSQTAADHEKMLEKEGRQTV